MNESLPTLAFADKHVTNVRDGTKTATIRLDLDSRIQLGRRVRFVDEDGDRFATAVIDDRGRDRLARLARTGVEGHRSYATPAELVAQMSDYYPDRRVTADTLADVLYWRVDDLWE